MVHSAAPTPSTTRSAPPSSASVPASMASTAGWRVTGLAMPMRTLALTIIAFNVTYGAAWAVLVLYASERLGMDAVGFGLLTTAVAVGGIIGTTAYGRLERRFALADIMRGGLLIETFTHLMLAITTSPGPASRHRRQAAAR